MSLKEKGIKFLFFGLLLLVPTKSEARAMTMCTASIEPAIKVTVSDAITNAPLEANIIVKDGEFEEVLKMYGATASGQNIYAGAFERSGNYIVKISKTGYKPVVISGINTTKNDCHVLTKRLNVSLEPLEQDSDVSK